MISFKEFYLLKESYFDSWQLPDGCEDWRAQYKNEVGQMNLNPTAVHRLMIQGCKPMITLDTNKHADIISDLQQKDFYIETIAAGEPGFGGRPVPDGGGQTFIGRDPEWVKRGIEAWRAGDHVEFGKALGFGEHSVDIGTEYAQAQYQQFHQKEKEEHERLQAQSLAAQKDFDHSSVPSL